MDVWDYIASIDDSNGDLEVDFEVDVDEEEGYAIVEAALLRAIGWESVAHNSYVGYTRWAQQPDWSQGKDASKNFTPYRACNCDDFMVYLRNGKDLEHFLARLKETFGWTVNFNLIELDRPCDYPNGPTLYRRIRSSDDWKREVMSENGSRKVF